MIRRLLLLVVPSLVLAAGCQSGPFGFFAKSEQTTFRTPQLRSDEARAIAENATGQDSAEQQQLVADLAQRLAAEPDPLVRESIMQSIARFNTPMVDQVLIAGLNDSDPAVRQRCCRALGARGQTGSVTALQSVLSGDDERDVQHAAARALGEIGSPEAVRALSVALQDRDPAMQLVGIEAARQATGKDLGNDAGAYLALVEGEAPLVATKPESATASGGLRRWLPF